jgi:uncharacterized protein (DUF952 family)
MSQPDTRLYKIVPAVDWSGPNADFRGAGVDLADGFIHLSTAAQVQETAARHFAGKSDLLLVAIDAPRLGAALKWEVSRGGVFPHLYGLLPRGAVLTARPLPLGAKGRHDFTGLLG